MIEYIPTKISELEIYDPSSIWTKFKKSMFLKWTTSMQYVVCSDISNLIFVYALEGKTKIIVFKYTSINSIYLKIECMNIFFR